MADALPNARLEVISQAGHLSPYENPSDANAAILRFLKSLEN
jgi:pimeloyl-ACP methyl ester carboxylesterase